MYPLLTAASGTRFDRRALVIESHPDLRTVLHGLLDAHGWFVMSTTRARDAATLARGTLPQVVFLDLEVRDMVADDVARQLRTASREALILGTTTQVGTRARRGCDAVLVKPFDLDFAALSFLIERYN